MTAEERVRKVLKEYMIEWDGKTYIASTPQSMNKFFDLTVSLQSRLDKIAEVAQRPVTMEEACSDWDAAKALVKVADKRFKEILTLAKTGDTHEG